MTSPLGTLDNPIRCHEPIGEWRYLHPLVSETHGFIRYKRMGSFRTEGNILDGYAIMDLTGAKFTELYFDMYHPGYVEESLPIGFRRIDSDALEDQLFAKMFEQPTVLSEVREPIVIGQQSHGYVQAKAQRLLLCGPLYYHAHDYFGYPRKDWNWAEIMNGARQLVEEFAGRVENKPIKVFDASVANHLLKTFHFDAINADLIDSTEDSVVVRAVHSVTEESLQFWFQRSTFEEEKLP